MVPLTEDRTVLDWIEAARFRGYPGFRLAIRLKDGPLVGAVGLLLSVECFVVSGLFRHHLADQRQCQQGQEQSVKDVLHNGWFIIQK